MTKQGSDPPRTHKWVRRTRPVRPEPPPPGALHAHIPGGAAPQAEWLAGEIRAALAGWPVVVLRVVATLDGRARLGRHPGRWLRNQVGHIVDERMWGGTAERCTDPRVPAFQLLGRHGRGARPDGEAWSPFVLRAEGMQDGNLEPGAVLRFEIVVAGAGAVAQVPALVAALRDPPESLPTGAPWTVTTVQAMDLDEDGEPRWRSLRGEMVPHVALDRLSEPRIRAGRLVLGFASATPLARRGEEGAIEADFPLIMDRVTRSFGAWMGRTGHKGPRLPVDDILRAAAEIERVADATQQIEVPVRLVAAEGAVGNGDERVTALVGAATFRGDFAGLAPLLRATAIVGMGPGRQHGLGQIAIR